MSKFESLSELPGLMDVDEQSLVNGHTPLVWDFNLPPHIDTEKLLINTRKIRQLHLVGAFTAGIVRSYEGETTTYTPGVDGVNPDGSAIASKTCVEHKADSHDSNLLDIYNFSNEYSKSYGKPIVMHRINRPETADKAVDMIREGTDQHEAWASSLDKSLKTSYQEMAKKHLLEVERESRGWKIVDGISTVNYAYGFATGSTLLMSLYVGFKLLNTAVDTSAMKMIYGDPCLDQRRHTLGFFGTSQPDRNLMLRGILSTGKLIKVRK